jgi:hypothetical protein
VVRPPRGGPRREQHELRTTRRVQRASTRYATLQTRTRLLFLVSLAPALARLAPLVLGISRQPIYPCTGAFLRATNASSVLNISYSRLNSGRARLRPNTRAGSTRSSHLTISRRKRPRTIRDDLERIRRPGEPEGVGAREDSAMRCACAPICRILSYSQRLSSRETYQPTRVRAAHHY